ncbi:MAG TPA: nicotinate phosphoribosyltransferase [Clostridiaceae bacterium]|nr:nicotinate phosphoribosyltransferase [Clostridiaceae bacterium]
MNEQHWNERTNMTMLTDFYELTMGNGYLKHGMADAIATFDLFFRDVPESGGYAIMAGVEQMIDYLVDLEFTEDNLQFLRERNLFSEEYLDYLRNFSFACDVWCVPEGTPIFPREPIVKVRGPLPQAQMIETMLLVTINHQSLIATKSSRIVRAAEGRPILEFGARRAQGYDASVLGARAAYIAGVAGTSCTIASEQFGIPSLGTMAHSWVQSFDSEYESFKAYAETFPDATVLLVDTYNTLKSGVPNAIRTAKEVLIPRGSRLKGIRIDSGDLTYLSQQARIMLDEAGLSDCQITASSSIDEELIRELLIQGAKIDVFGVGERLITSKAEPVFGGVYKLASIEKGGIEHPRMKISDNPAKVTSPANKEVWRFFDKETGDALADLITLADEVIDETKPYVLFDPNHTWKRKTVENYTIRRLLEPVFLKGQCVYKRRDIESIRAYCRRELATLWDSVKRFENPQVYYVDLSQKLWDLRDHLLRLNGD